MIKILVSVVLAFAVLRLWQMGGHDSVVFVLAFYSLHNFLDTHAVALVRPIQVRVRPPREWWKPKL